MLHKGERVYMSKQQQFNVVLKGSQKEQVAVTNTVQQKSCHRVQVTLLQYKNNQLQIMDSTMSRK